VSEEVRNFIAANFDVLLEQSKALNSAVAPPAAAAARATR
jgi:hypothetical protein